MRDDFFVEGVSSIYNREGTVPSRLVKMWPCSSSGIELLGTRKSLFSLEHWPMSQLRVAVTCLLLATVWKLSPFFRSPSNVTVNGSVHADFQEVVEVFKQNLQSGKEQGASFAVYHNGQVLVDLWGGAADLDADRSWQQNTLCQVWSVTKGVTAVIMAHLVDRGLLAYQDLVHVHWPEFKQNGKENITLAMLLSHQAGLVYLDRPVSLREYRDKWEAVERLMAEARPAWPPGTMYSYHAYTYGMYADALVRRVDPQHRNISQYFQEEIAQPFGLDFYIGLPLSMHFRVARASFVSNWQVLMINFLARPARWKWLAELLPGGIVHNSVHAIDDMDNVQQMNDPELQAVGISSAVGFGTARSLAKMYDFLANNGTVRGRRLLSQQQIEALSTSVTGHIPVLFFPDQGYAMGTGVDVNIQGNLIFGHRGFGGQSAFADPESRVGMAYITNFNGPHSEHDDPRAQDLIEAFYRCFAKYCQSKEHNNTT